MLGNAYTNRSMCMCVFVAVKETQSGSFGGLNRADSDIILKFLLKLWVREVKNREIKRGSKISRVWPYDICLKQKTLSSSIFITIMNYVLQLTYCRIYMIANRRLTFFLVSRFLSIHSKPFLFWTLLLTLRLYHPNVLLNWRILSTWPLDSWVLKNFVAPSM